MFKSVYGHTPVKTEVQQLKPHMIDIAARTKAKQQSDIRDLVRTKLQKRMGGTPSEGMVGATV